MAIGKQKARELSIRGDLQIEIMGIVWRLGHAKVDDVRGEQPVRRRSAYTTVQTVMNRLVDRGLLTRRREGHAFTYRACYDEATYLARTIGDRLAEASPEARRAALINLVDHLDDGERDEVARYARKHRRAV